MLKPVSTFILVAPRQPASLTLFPRPRSSVYLEGIARYSPVDSRRTTDSNHSSDSTDGKKPGLSVLVQRRIKPGSDKAKAGQAETLSMKNILEFIVCTVNAFIVFFDFLEGRLVKTAQIRWQPDTGWEDIDFELAAEASLVLVFADPSYFREPACFDELRQCFPQAFIAGCSSSGNVLGSGISDDDMVATVVRLERGRFRLAVSDVPEGEEKASADKLMAQLKAAYLQHVIALSEGLSVNGSALASGLNAGGEGRIVTTGGLAGDGIRFGETWVMANAPARKGYLALLGLYGDLRVKDGCFAGWQEFAGERFVTRSEGNVVFDIH